MSKKNKIKSKKTILPFLITLAGSVLLAMMLFLPFASATGDFKEHIIDHPDWDYIEEIGMTNEEAMNLSLVEFARIYVFSAKQDYCVEISVSCIVIISICAFFMILTLISSCMNAPIATGIFDVMALVSFGIIQYDFKKRGVLPSNSFDWGIANYLVYVLGVIILGGAIWLLIEQIKIKKRWKMEQKSMRQNNIKQNSMQQNDLQESNIK